MKVKKPYSRIYIEITNSCNFSCPFCPSSSLNQSEFMKLDDFKVVIDKIKKYTKTVYFHVKGEPLLHPYLKDMIDICFNNNIDVCLTTNGVLINKYEDVFVQKDLSKKALHCLHELEEPYKEVFELRVFGELSFAEIGSIFGKTETWARVTYHRARLKIKERMDENEAIILYFDNRTPASVRMCRDLHHPRHLRKRHRRLTY